MECQERWQELKKNICKKKKGQKHYTSFNITRPICGKAITIHDSEIDIVTDDNKVIDRSDVGLVNITIYDNKELK